MYHVGMAIVGLLALGAVVLPFFLRDRLISYPIVVVSVGALLPLVFGSEAFDPTQHGFAAEHLAEFAVIVALTGLGLSIDRRVGWRAWMTTWRMLAFTMPLSIAAAALTGWWLVGLAPAAALLFGAALAPTDPVLAVDVQTGPPTRGRHDADEPDEVRFGLTSESALNDGLAFPFTNLAVLVAVYGLQPGDWVARWVLVDVLYKIAGGFAFGWLIGRLLGHVTLRLIRAGGAGEKVERVAAAVMVLAMTLLSFGVTEMLGAYGFIAVFVTAYVVRDLERTHRIHDHLHESAEQIERLAMSIVLLLLGAAFAGGLYAAVTWPMVGTGLLLVLVARPVAGLVALTRSRATTRPERAMVSFFGIRGLGSIYYLAHGLNRAEFTDPTTLWALTAVTILISLLVHGLTARPAMAWLERVRERDGA